VPPSVCIGSAARQEPSCGPPVPSTTFTIAGAASTLALPLLPAGPPPARLHSQSAKGCAASASGVSPRSRRAGPGQREGLDGGRVTRGGEGERTLAYRDHGSLEQTGPSTLQRRPPWLEDKRSGVVSIRQEWADVGRARVQCGGWAGMDDCAGSQSTRVGKGGRAGGRAMGGCVVGEREMAVAHTCFPGSHTFRTSSPCPTTADPLQSSPSACTSYKTPLFGPGRGLAHLRADPVFAAIFVSAPSYAYVDTRAFDTACCMGGHARDCREVMLA
jgi:hypothetical protein